MSSLKHRPEPDRVILHRCMSGGIITASITKHIDAFVDGTCPWCGAPHENKAHFLWKCPRFADVRTSVWGERVPEHSSLPPMLALQDLAPDM
eukprot:7693406-Alexandrium_andersonii.AAC.1